MNILAILIALGADRFLSHLHHLRRYDALVTLSRRLRGFIGGIFDGTFGLLVVLAVPVVLTAFVQNAVSDGMLSLLGLVFAIVVLLFCLGPRDLALDVASYCEARESDDQELAVNVARQITGVPGRVDGHLDRSVIHGIFARANPSMFAVIFWFVLLGPVGAVLYRGTAVLANYYADEAPGDFRDATSRLLGILDWVPARLAALSYALSGHFDGAYAAWRQGVHHEFGLEASSIELLMEVGNGSLGQAFGAEAGVEQVKEAMGLVWRSVMVWLVIISIMTLAGFAD